MVRGGVIWVTGPTFRRMWRGLAASVDDDAAQEAESAEAEVLEAFVFATLCGRAHAVPADPGATLDRLIRGAAKAQVASACRSCIAPRGERRVG